MLLHGNSIFTIISVALDKFTSAPNIQLSLRLYTIVCDLEPPLLNQQAAKQKSASDNGTITGAVPPTSYALPY